MASRHNKPMELWKEADHQAELIERVEFQWPRLTPLLVAVPNQAFMGGGKSASARQYNALKSAGMKKGVADLLFLFPSKYYPYLALELKTPEHKGKKGGGLRPDQIDFLLAVRDVGGAATVGYGWSDAFSILEKYLEDQEVFFDLDMISSGVQTGS